MYYKDLELPSSGTNTTSIDFNSKTPVSALSPSSATSSSSSLVNSQSSPMHIHSLQPKSTLHDLLMRKDKLESSPDRSILGKPQTKSKLMPYVFIGLFRNVYFRISDVAQ